jgi:hypothetical protein
MTLTHPVGIPSQVERWWPSRYGADDQAGALNEITPAKVCLAFDDLPKQGGQSTPAAAMGNALIARLKKNGITFAVL